MKLVEHLSQEQRQQLNRMRDKPVKKKRKKKQEHLSRKDIEELMGTHMDIYERRRGAVRKK